MAWERRERGGRYFYRREGGRKVYVGTGAVGELAAELERRRRSARAQQREAEAEELARAMDSVKAADGALEALSEGVDLLVARALMGAGYHRHERGEWRRRRGRKDT